MGEEFEVGESSRESGDDSVALGVSQTYGRMIGMCITAHSVKLLVRRFAGLGGASTIYSIYRNELGFGRSGRVQEYSLYVKASSLK